jgi:hypothetical protein
MHHPGDIRAFDQVLVDHLLELGFVHSPPREIVIPETVTVLMPPQLRGAADIWWWSGPPPPITPNARDGWPDPDNWTDWVFRTRVIHNYPLEDDGFWDLEGMFKDHDVSWRFS